ncbi:interferon-related developmental regulator 2-like [Macrosteles quadrilineatus]|uniref:interferon-related developmental regulator 2-like n=1 Tax=Macrosteles quadrilineatus TaxID=74068 RepID=UPI0023E0C1CA|nr:interferon-related developmental regulator 2-like [Macrosteles quadrilineatus]XP_054287310.1 interferon-related developmental regulator 2-like [Macrosteles quadrilineatus]
MPKGKRKGKSGGVSASRKADIGTSDEDSINDNASVISMASETTVMEEGVAGDEVDEQSQDEVFEEKMCEAIDGITQKSAQGRTNSLDSVSQALTKKYIPDFIIDRRLTICDGIERCLKKGRGAEQASAAQLAALLCIQLGVSDLTDQVCHDLKPLLTFTITDNSGSPSARAKCCWTLAMLAFLDSTDPLADTHRTLLSVFSGSYCKGDGTPATVTPDLANLHAAALSAWSLLLTIIDIHAFNDPNLGQIVGLLDSPHLEVRMAAGEVIALMLERGRQYDDDYEWEASEQLIDKLRQLATDSHKYRAKKDRKTQRSSFRDILKYVEDDMPPNIQVRFGQETLALDSWCKKKQYDAFCQVLGSGMNLHLSENDLLREVFELGEKLVHLNLAAHKQSKIERHLMNQANFKARCITRGKNRDKRSAVFAS